MGESEVSESGESMTELGEFLYNLIKIVHGIGTPGGMREAFIRSKENQLVSMRWKNIIKM